MHAPGCSYISTFLISMCISVVRGDDYTVTPLEVTFSDCFMPCSEAVTINFIGVPDFNLEDTETIVMEFSQQLQDPPFEGYNSMTFPSPTNGELVDTNGNHFTTRVACSNV